ncbi:hypothetical protein RFI_25499, partial [Reticulomyxa filosa]
CNSADNQYKKKKKTNVKKNNVRVKGIALEFLKRYDLWGHFASEHVSQEISKNFFFFLSPIQQPSTTNKQTNKKKRLGNMLAIFQPPEYTAEFSKLYEWLKKELPSEIEIVLHKSIIRGLMNQTDGPDMDSALRLIEKIRDAKKGKILRNRMFLDMLLACEKHGLLDKVFQIRRLIDEFSIPMAQDTYACFFRTLANLQQSAKDKEKEKDKNNEDKDDKDKDKEINAKEDDKTHNNHYLQLFSEHFAK